MLTWAVAWAVVSGGAAPAWLALAMLFDFLIVASVCAVVTTVKKAKVK